MSLSVGTSVLVPYEVEVSSVDSKSLKGKAMPLFCSYHTALRVVRAQK